MKAEVVVAADWLSLCVLIADWLKLSDRPELQAIMLIVSYVRFWLKVGQIGTFLIMF